MKPLVKPEAPPRLLAALHRAIDSHGTSSLDTSVSAALWRRALVGPAEDFLARPGKLLRTTLVHAGWMIGGGAADTMPERIPLAIELLHAGSLIVDDVEDDALERRGGPALHRVVGAPLAINTGSWMYFLALSELAALALPPARELAAYRLATSTLVRCHQGQALDLATRITALAASEVESVVATTTRLKTAELCRFAAELGALAAGGGADAQACAGRFAALMGTGLQMLDDLGSLTSTVRRDKAHEDLRAGRPTWPWAWLAEQGPFAFASLQSQLEKVIAGTGDLDALASSLAARIEARGRDHVRVTLDEALATLAHRAGGDDVTHLIANELARMEASYG